VLLLHPDNHPHLPAPVLNVPQRTCTNCGRVSGYLLSAHCPVCGRHFVPLTDWRAERRQQAEEADGRLP
jgi:hypothetical protein